MERSILVQACAPRKLLKIALYMTKAQFWTFESIANLVSKLGFCIFIGFHKSRTLLYLTVLRRVEICCFLPKDVHELGEPTPILM